MQALKTRYKQFKNRNNVILHMKYKIEKNTVQETLIIPLYARKMCS